jgi:hypothetical protein
MVTIGNIGVVTGTASSTSFFGFGGWHYPSVVPSSEFTTGSLPKFEIRSRTVGHKEKMAVGVGFEPTVPV